ncbi:MoaD/ThiS family protein [Geobacter pelophilus]|uniref:MoaD/ThiS family protein n=1 Tax=Geoanaerobacter pelophilus TaxID=60036 RepID=A0AAW4L464_9BACT|nr:MoaD/ThiS family protein [Geoanaerobacter pelophilus]MBT0665534.1 MoaD/ThiS family protein [Geoanaerobacter pelophilus]
MNVTVVLVGPFRVGRFNEEVREYPPGTSVQEVIAELGLSGPLLGTVLINEVHAGLDALLHDGDTLYLLPFMDGG